MSDLAVVPQLKVSLPGEWLRFLRWLELTQGRDKLYRFVCYSSKWIVPMMIAQGIKPENASRLKGAASALGVTRKVMRLFRSLDFLQDGLTALNSKDGVERLLGLVKGLALCCWLLCDHVQWLQKVGTLRLDKDKMARIDVHHSRAWFVGLLTGALLAIYKLVQIAEEERRVRGTAMSDAECNKQLAALDAKRVKQLKGVIKNGVDLAIPSARLGWLPVSDSTVGWCGTITSIMGIMDTYPAATSKAKSI